MPTHISRWGGNYVQWSQNSYAISTSKPRDYTPNSFVIRVDAISACSIERSNIIGGAWYVIGSGYKMDHIKNEIDKLDI